MPNRYMKKCYLVTYVTITNHQRNYCIDGLQVSSLTLGFTCKSMGTGIKYAMIYPHNSFHFNTCPLSLSKISLF